MQTKNVYQSILGKLSLIPDDYLKEVDTILHNFMKEIKTKEHNRLEILELAGTWSDMIENDFEEFLQVAKESQLEVDNRIIEL